MDIGPLELGDYLGILLVNSIYLAISHLVFDVLIYDNFQQLVQYLLRQILFAHCRFEAIYSLHFTYNYGIIIVTELMNDYAGAKSGWDTFAVQSCIWGGCCEWCYISGAFQCNPKLWPQPHRLFNSFALFGQFLVFICRKHNAWSVGKCFSSSNSLMHASYWIIDKMYVNAEHAHKYLYGLFAMV